MPLTCDLVYDKYDFKGNFIQVLRFQLQSIQLSWSLSKHAATEELVPHKTLQTNLPNVLRLEKGTPDSYDPESLAK